jgi:hypothetical protein
MATVIRQLIDLLDGEERRIRSGEISSGFNRLVDGIGEIEMRMGTQAFVAETVPLCLAHTIRNSCHEEPIT